MRCAGPYSAAFLYRPQGACGSTSERSERDQRIIRGVRITGCNGNEVRGEIRSLFHQYYLCGSWVHICGGAN